MSVSSGPVIFSPDFEKRVKEVTRLVGVYSKDPETIASIRKNLSHLGETTDDGGKKCDS